MILKVTPCAFHNDQLITNFCRAPECLLPMCPKCIKLHSEEHAEANTKPLFQTINAIVKEVQRQYIHTEKLYERASQELLEVQSYKKKNEQTVRKKLIEARERLIRDFQKHLIEVEQEIVKKIIQYGEEVVQQLKSLDEEIDMHIGSIENSLNELYSDKCLKNVIDYFSLNFPSSAGIELAAVNQRIQLMNQRSLQLQVNDSQIITLGHSLRRFMSVNILKREHVQSSTPQTTKTPTVKYRADNSFS